MKRIGLLGGSFDPIHFGHLHLAVHMLEKNHVDKVLFCPASQSPFKVAQPLPMDAEHRLNMVRLAVDEIPGCEVLEYEIGQKGPTYTIDTVRYLYEKFGKKAVQIRLILGQDMVVDFPLWKEAEFLLELAPPLIGSRKGEDCSLLLGEINKLQEVLHKGEVLMPIMEISSTEVRDRLKKRLYCGHLVPAKVLDYIYQNQLYL